MNKVKHTWNKWDSVFVRYDDGSVIEEKPSWYFGIDRSNSQKASQYLQTTNFNFEVKNDPKFPKFSLVYIHNQPRNLRGNVKKTDAVLFLEGVGVPTYEGDLLPDKRWFIDNEIEIAQNFTKLYIDIETDDSSPKIQIGKDYILSFAAVDDKGQTYFEKLDDMSPQSEKKLLTKFLKLISKYDLILGWNTSGFDLPYLKDRMVLYELNKTDLWCWKQLAHFDLLKRFRHIFRFDSHLKSFSLDFISKHFLGKGKIEHTEKIIELWKTNLDKLKEYNIEDCNLVRELDKKLGVSDMMIRQCQWCGVPPSQFGLYSIIDSYILKKAHRVGKFCITSKKAIQERGLGFSRTKENPNDTDTEKSKYIGAAVLDPKIGKYDNVYTFDFKGLYPSMMRTSNIGYDSLRYEANDQRIINPGTQHIKRKSGTVVPTYFEKIPSVINLAISDLINKRGEYKDLKLKMIEEGTNKGREWERVVSDEIIVKELANSTYGIMGLEYGRYYSVDVAESITLFGQWCLEFAKSYFEGAGYKVIYGDTDSVFVSTGQEKLDKDLHLKLFHENLKRVLKNQYNIDETFIQLNFDKEYDSFILIAKKTYVGHVINIEGKKTDDLYARGMEFHKKNTFSYAAKKQKELIEYILYKNPTRNELTEWGTSCRREYYDKEFTKDELTLTQRVGKSVDEYSKTPPLHVRLAQEIKFETGVDLYKSEVDFIITSSGSKSSGKTDGVVAEDFTGEFDRDYYWTNKTEPVLTRVTEVLYPGENIFGLNLTLF